MKKFNVVFQNSQLLMVIEAEGCSEARQIFNKSISIKERKTGAENDK